MRKKLFTLMTLLLTAVTGAWATSYIPTTLKTITTTQTVIINDIQSTSETWFTIPSKNMTSKSVAADVDMGITAGSYSCLQVKTDGGVFNSSKRVIHMLVKGITGVKAIGQADSGRGFQIGATEYTAGMSESTSMTVVAGSSSAENPVSCTGLDGSKTYIISIFAYSKDTYLYAVKFTAAPTGAQAPVFSPVTGSSVAEGSKIEITSTNSTSIKYKWTSSDETPTSDWLTYDADAKVAVPASSSGTPYLHAQGFKGEDGGTPGYAFYTITAPDTEAPVFDSATPANGATDVAVDAALTATYNENIVIDNSKITLVKTSDDSPVEFTATASGAVLTVTPNDALAYNTAYTLTIGAGAVADGSGNATAAATVIAFTTVKETVATPTIVVLGNKAVKITCDGADAIYYEMDNASIKTSGTKSTYTEMFIPAANGTLYAYAVKAGANDSEVATQTITLPVVGDVTGNLLITLQPEAPQGSGDVGDYDSHTFTKGDYSMANTAALQNTGAFTGFPNMFKVNKGTITITPPSDVTIQSIKVYGVSNNTATTHSSVSAGTGTTLVSSTGILTPRNYTVAGEPLISEVVLSKETPTEGAAFEFKVAQASGDNTQVRFYVEAYGTTSATKKTINRTKTYTTYVTSYDLDFTSTDKLTAYIATAADADNVTLTSVDKVPAGTPVVIKATELDTDIDVNIAASIDDVTANKLKVSDGKTTIGGEGKYDYILSDGMFYHASAGILPLGKAYLHLDEAPTAPELHIVIDGENGDDITTGISAIEQSTSDIEHSEVYNLNGQRVSQTTKGLYIVNGKKVVVK